MITDGSSPALTSKENRESWEKAFNTHFIQPVLENLDIELNAAMSIIAEDKSKLKLLLLDVL